MSSDAIIQEVNETVKGVVQSLQDNVFLMNQAAYSLHKLAMRMLPALDKTVVKDLSIKRERNDMVTVEVKCTFLKIGDINTLSQDFDAEVLVQAKWEEPALDFSERVAGQQAERPLYDEKKYWDPQLIITNVIEEFRLEEKTYNVKFHEAGYTHAVVILHWKFDGKFRENLELEHFPFDIQELTIQVSSERSIEEIDIAEDTHSMSTVNINMFQDTQEWSVYQHVECVHKFTTREYASIGIHPVLHVQSRVKRKVGFFLWNYIVIVLLILGLAFGTTSIDPNNPDRMACTVTLFLTCVTFKLVVKATLPTISYLTYLDIYILAALVFLTLQSSESSIMCALSKVLHIGEVVVWDQCIMASLAVILVAFHVIFGFYIYSTALQKRRLMQQKDKEYGKKRDYLEHHGVLLTVGYSSLMVEDEES